VIPNPDFKIDEIEFIPIHCYHHQLPVYGFRVGDLTYITLLANMKIFGKNFLKMFLWDMMG
jgi:hypothetical protein